MKKKLKSCSINKRVINVIMQFFAAVVYIIEGKQNLCFFYLLNFYLWTDFYLPSCCKLCFCVWNLSIFFGYEINGLQLCVCSIFILTAERLCFIYASVYATFAECGIWYICCTVLSLHLNLCLGINITLDSVQQILQQFFYITIFLQYQYRCLVL